MQFDISELLVVHQAINKKAPAQNFCFLGKDFQKDLFVPSACTAGNRVFCF